MMLAGRTNILKLCTIVWLFGLMIMRYGHAAPSQDRGPALKYNDIINMSSGDVRLWGHAGNRFGAPDLGEPLFGPSTDPRSTSGYDFIILRKADNRNYQGQIQYGDQFEVISLAAAAGDISGIVGKADNGLVWYINPDNRWTDVATGAYNEILLVNGNDARAKSGNQLFTLTSVDGKTGGVFQNDQVYLTVASPKISMSLATGKPRIAWINTPSRWGASFGELIVGDHSGSNREQDMGKLLLQSTPRTPSNSALYDQVINLPVMMHAQDQTTQESTNASIDPFSWSEGQLSEAGMGTITLNVDPNKQNFFILSPEKKITPDSICIVIMPSTWSNSAVSVKVFGKDETGAGIGFTKTQDGDETISGLEIASNNAVPESSQYVLHLDQKASTAVLRITVQDNPYLELDPIPYTGGKKLLYTSCYAWDDSPVSISGTIQPATAAAAAPVISAAWYGSDTTLDKNLDVTDILQNIVAKYGFLAVPRNQNAFFGKDPVPGVVKTLAVQYVVDGKATDTRSAEGHDLIYPTNTDPAKASAALAELNASGAAPFKTATTTTATTTPAPTPSTTTAAPVISSAWYGSDTTLDKNLDVTDILQNIVAKYGFLAVPRNQNAFFGKDPVPGVVKTLAVQYVVNGKAIDTRSAEGLELIYPTNTDPAKASAALAELNASGAAPFKAAPTPSTPATTTPASTPSTTTPAPTPTPSSPSQDTIDAFFSAIENQKLDDVKKLLQQWPELALAQNSAGSPAIVKASGYPNIDIITQILNNGADINQVSSASGRTPLHNAIAFSTSDVVAFLIKNGANIQAINQKSYGSTPLAVAITDGNLDMLKALLAAGANVDQGFSSGPKFTPLHLVVSALGASKSDNDKDNMFKALITYKANPNSQDADGQTPLHQAAKWGLKDCAQALISAGATVNIQDKMGNTPLHTAIIQATAYKTTDVALLLLANGADITIKNADGKTALDIAKENNNTEVYAALEKKQPSSQSTPSSDVLATNGRLVWKNSLKLAAGQDKSENHLFKLLFNTTFNNAVYQYRYSDGLLVPYDMISKQLKPDLAKYYPDNSMTYIALSPEAKVTPNTIALSIATQSVLWDAKYQPDVPKTKTQILSLMGTNVMIDVNKVGGTMLTGGKVTDSFFWSFKIPSLATSQQYWMIIDQRLATQPFMRFGSGTDINQNIIGECALPSTYRYLSCATWDDEVVNQISLGIVEDASSMVAVSPAAWRTIVTPDSLAWKADWKLQDDNCGVIEFDIPLDELTTSYVALSREQKLHVSDQQAEDIIFKARVTHNSDQTWTVRLQAISNIFDNSFSGIQIDEKKIKVTAQDPNNPVAHLWIKVDQSSNPSIKVGQSDVVGQNQVMNLRPLAGQKLKYVGAGTALGAHTDQYNPMLYFQSRPFDLGTIHCSPLPR